MSGDMDVNLVAQVEYLDGSPGGISRYCYEQTRNIATCMPRNARVRVTSIRRRFPLGMLSTKIAGLGFRQGPGILHNLTEMPLIPSRKDKGAMLVNTAHEFQRILYPEITRAEGRLPSEMPGYLVKKSYMWDILKGDCIIASSTQTRSEARTLGFDNEVFVVNPGVAGEFLSGPGRRRRKGAFRVGYIGAVRQRKGIETLVKSMDYLNDDFELRIYGMIFDRFRDDFNRIMKGARNTRYCGVAPRSALVRLYDGLDAFVMPSLYEGFGISILEAQARGIPVVVDSWGMLPRETAMHCIKADGAERIASVLWRLKEKGYSERSRRTAKAYARSFTWKRTAEETLRAYEKLTS